MRLNSASPCGEALLLSSSTARRLRRRSGKRIRARAEARRATGRRSVLRRRRRAVMAKSSYLSIVATVATGRSSHPNLAPYIEDAAKGGIVTAFPPLFHWTKSFDCRYRDPGFCERLGAGGSFGAVSGP